MRPRYIILTIDTITELIKDYVGLDELPADARAISIQMRPTDGGKLAIDMISDTWTQEQDPIDVNFKIKRMYGVL
jgi:hypothetical protein